jgi:effector-binding domain-containing protein
MTVPVQQPSSQGAWKISFVMPSQYTLETLPKPNNKNIQLSLIPSKQYVVIQFSGNNTDKNLAQHEASLIDYIQANQIKTVGVLNMLFITHPGPYLLCVGMR